MKNKKVTVLIFTYLLVFFLTVPGSAWAMHIMEGFLPMGWAGFWYVLSIPFFYLGLRSIQKTVSNNPSLKMLLGLAGAFAFVLSALKIPSVTGSCSHPTGVGLGTIMFGPLAMTVLGTIILLFQALLLAHGGITTLGANTFSMAVAGPLVAFVVFKLSGRLGAPRWLSVFLAAALADLLTYVVTSLQLALAFPAEYGGITASLGKFLSIFAVTQLPLAVMEGIITVVVFNILTTYSRQELQDLSVLSREVPQ